MSQRRRSELSNTREDFFATFRPRSLRLLTPLDEDSWNWMKQLLNRLEDAGQAELAEPEPDRKIVLFLSRGQRVVRELELEQPESAKMALEIMERMLRGRR